MNTERLQTLRARLSSVWRVAERPLRLILMVAILAFLARSFGAIGWGQVLRHLPTSPLFYAVFMVNYLCLPFYEVLIYNWMWGTGAAVLPALLHKRIFNETVLEYTGETNLFIWARKHVDLPSAEVFRNIRDVNILSTIAGNLVTFLVLIVLVSTMADRLGVGDAVLLRRGALFTGGLIVALVVAASIFRRHLLTLSLSKTAGITGLHIMRGLTQMLLQALQWHCAVLTIKWQTWALFVALQAAIWRLPLIPTKDLFFAGLATRLGARISLAPEALAGLFLASAGLNLIVHGLAFVAGHVLMARRSRLQRGPQG